MKSIITLLTNAIKETYYKWFVEVGSITRYTDDEFYRHFGETKGRK